MKKTSYISCVFILMGLGFGSCCNGIQDVPVVKLDNKEIEVQQSHEGYIASTVGGLVGVLGGANVLGVRHACSLSTLRSAVEKNVNTTTINMNATISSPEEPPAAQGEGEVRSMDHTFEAYKPVLPCLARLAATAAIGYAVAKVAHKVANAKPLATQAVLLTRQLVNNFALLVSVRSVLLSSVSSLNYYGALTKRLDAHVVSAQVGDLVYRHHIAIDAALESLNNVTESLFTDDVSPLLEALNNDAAKVTESYQSLANVTLFDTAYEHKEAMELITRLHMLAKQSGHESDDAFEMAAHCNEQLIALVADFDQQLQVIISPLNSALRWSTVTSSLANAYDMVSIFALLAKEYVADLFRKNDDEEHEECYTE